MHGLLQRLLDRTLLALIQRSHTARQRLCVTAPATIEGEALRVPLMAGVGAQNRILAPHDRQLQRVARNAMAHSPGAILDVGCNIGHFLELCLLSDRSRRYVGFDPSPACCYYVEKFIRENTLPAHSVLPVGLSDRTGAAPLLQNGPFDVCATVSSTLNQRSRFTGHSVTVTVPGDTLIPQLGLEGIALIKIDVEGLELEVLRGLEQTLARERPIIAFEVLLYADLLQGEAGEGVAAIARQRQKRALDLEAFLRERGYELFRLKRDTSLAPLETLDPGPATDHGEMDHVALPEEQAQAFLATYEGERAPVRRTKPAAA